MDNFGWPAWAGDVGDYLPRIIGAIAILIIGWIVALICRSLTRKALNRLNVNERLSSQAGAGLDISRIVASIVFWVIMLFALIGMFNLLNFPSVSNPLSALAAAVMLYLPRLLLAAILAVVAWLLATVARKLVRRGIAATKLEQKLAESNAGSDTAPMSQTLADVVFWLIILLFLPAIVAALQMHGLLLPLTNMVHELLGFLPNIIAAIFIGGIGYLIAKVLRNLVTSILSVTRVDKLTQGKDGKSGIKLSGLCGTLVFILVLVPALIAALNALQIDVIAQPARHMLKLLLDAVPNILAAGVIVFIAWFIGRFVAEMLSQLLAQMGFDRLPAHLGFKPGAIETGPDGSAHMTPSQVVGRIALFFVMAFAVVEAANRLGFSGVNGLFEQLIAFGAQVLFGLIILAVGQWLANLAVRAIRHTSGKHSGTLAAIARIAILGLVIAMGLHAMGFAEAIVNLAFGLTLGAVAVAVALAFGLGGREAASRITKRWADDYLEGKKDDPSRFE